MSGQVDEAVKEERLARLQALLVDQQMAFNAAQVGRTLPVLFERPGRHAGQVVGRSPYLQGVHAEGPASLIGRIVPVTITGSSLNSLSGELALEMETA
jgi:tRNA-2-methylthio-N6-dimethylallyladenosine synthase